MFAIVTYKNGQRDRALVISQHDTEAEAQRTLAEYLEREQSTKNSDANGSLKIEYGTYTPPTDEQLLKYLVEGFGYTSLLEALENLKGGYDAAADPEWYTWPTAIDKYRFDTTNYEVVELPTDEDNDN